MSDAEPTILFPSRAEWAAWLADHHDEGGGVWLKFAKQGADVRSVTYAEAVEVALCYGWVDGQAGRVDDAFWRQR